MDLQENQKHFLLVTYPLQGHINPALLFAKRLIQTGAHLTFFTTVYAHRRFIKDSSSFPDSLKVAEFSDGYDDGAIPDINQYITEYALCGSKALSRLIETFANEGRPVTCLIYAIVVPWAGAVAQKSGLPSALLWIQPATMFAIYHYYFSGFKELILDNISDPSYSIQLPGLPLLKAQDLPSFSLSSDSHAGILKTLEYHFEVLSQEPDSYPILVNTFDELESVALKAVDKFKLIGVGPFVPSSFLDETAPLSSGADYINWLDTKEKSSVVYVSFGSMAVLSGKQMDELARGLVDSRKPFLWVIRSSEHGSNQQVKGDSKDEKYKEILSKEHVGMIVPWCSQVEVLNHSSIGCFVTHCGWNSTLETLSMGVPTVAFPQWSDQSTNAKLIEDDWKMGVRVKPNEEDKIVEGEEIVRCLKEVMEGDSGKELSCNARKWKKLAREAVKPGGSSERNVRAFVEEIGKGR